MLKIAITFWLSTSTRVHWESDISLLRDHSILSLDRSQRFSCNALDSWSPPPWVFIDGSYALGINLIVAVLPTMSLECLRYLKRSSLQVRG